MSQGYEMQKHRADGLKGHLDTANRRIEMLESEFAEIESLAKSRLATACALQAEVEKLEHSLSDAMEQIEAIQGSNAVHMERVAELDKVHAAAGRHLEANGPCDLRDESDEADDYEGGNCSESDCTYCALDRIASAVDEAPDQRGGGGLMGVVENAVRQADAAEGGRVAAVERGRVGLFQELHVAYLWQTSMRKLLGLPEDTKPSGIELAVRKIKARVEVLEKEAFSDLGTLTHAARRLGVERSAHTLRSIIGLLEARVAELEEPQVGWTECPHCNMEHDVQLSRGRTNDPNRADQGGEKIRLTVGTDAHTGERTFTRQRGEVKS